MVRTLPVETKAAFSTRTRALQWALLLLPLVVFLVGAWRYRWMSDDGFINLRVVRELQAGHGPVFNAGERVEASTSPLWVAVLAVGDILLPLRLEWIAVLTGIVFTIAGTALIMAGAAQLIADRDRSSLLFPAGVWVVAAFVPSWKFASSGLENGCFALWFGASFFLLARWAARDDRASVPGAMTAVVVGLGPLVRPDLAVVSAALLLAVVLAAAAPARARLRFVAYAIAVPFAYQVFRMGFYDSLVPNTAAAKEASRSWWSQGLRYLRDSGRPYWLWIGLVGVVLLYVALVRGLGGTGDRRRLALALASAGGGLVHLAYVARVGGDFMHARLALPGLTAIAAPVAVVALDRNALKIAGTAVVCGWAVVCVAFLRSQAEAPVAFIGQPRNAITLADYGWQHGGPSRQWFTGDGVYFIQTRIDAPRHAGLPRVAVATYGVGVGSYALGTDTYVLDMLGLGDAFTAHLRLQHRGVVAHEKPLPLPWVAARLLAPDARVDERAFVMPPFFIARPLDQPVGTFADRTDAARRALECGALHAYLERVRGPVGVSGFVTNVWHSVSDTRLRIPPEPAAAVQRYCR